MNIDIIPNGAIKRVHLSQNDIGRTLTFNLFNGSTQYDVPIGATVKIQGTKPSGFGFSETCTVSGNVVTVDTTEEMTDEYGYIDTELQITDSGDVIGTSNFILAIERNPHPDNITDGTQITAQSLEVRIEALEESALGGLTDEAKQALLNCFAHVAWIDEDGQDYYDALEDALYPTAVLTSISAVYTQSGTIYNDALLNDLKNDLIVTAHYDNSTSEVVTAYQLSGVLTVGTSVITVTYSGKTTAFNVTVSMPPYHLENGSHTFSTNLRSLEITQGNHIKYDAPNATSQTGSQYLGAYLNLSTVSENDNDATTASNINLSDVLFTIPANAEVVFQVKNIDAVDLLGGQKFAFALRNDSTTTSITTGDHTTYEDITVSVTVNADTPVTCVFGYLRHQHKYFEADIYLYVDGERWI